MGSLVSMLLPFYNAEITVPSRLRVLVIQNKIEPLRGEGIRRETGYSGMHSQGKLYCASYLSRQISSANVLF